MGVLGYHLKWEWGQKNVVEIHMAHFQVPLSVITPKYEAVVDFVVNFQSSITILI